jgi:hypothetical protein
MDDESRFEELTKRRALKRQTTSSEGILIGSCPDMCPEYERLERHLHLDLTKPFETVEGSNLVNHTKAVKKYHRPAAGNEAPLPEDVRPPSVLLNTLEYLLSKNVLMRSDVPFLETQKFLRDRMRSIRQDLTLQNIKSLDSIYLNECIARFHIYCSIVFELPNDEEALISKSDFDPFQNLEQLRKVLTTLSELYEDGHKQMKLNKVSFEFENESEFQAYRILAHLDDPLEVFSENSHIPKGVKQSLTFQSALELASVFHSRNIVRFDKIIDSQISFCLFSGFALRWRIILLNTLSLVCEKGFERKELIYGKTFPINLSDLPADLLIQGKAHDFERQRCVSNLCQDILNDFLHKQTQTLSNEIAKDCWKKADETHKEQQRIYTERKSNLAREVSLHFINSNIGNLMSPLIHESIDLQTMNKMESDKSSLISDIYKSSMDLIIPYYLKIIISEVMAETKANFKILKKYFHIYRQLAKTGKENKLEIQTQPIAPIENQDLQSLYLDKLMNRVMIPKHHPIYEKYKSTCENLLKDNVDNFENIKKELEGIYPDFLLSPNQQNNIGLPQKRKASPIALDEVENLEKEIKNLQEQLNVEQTFADSVDRKLEKLLKTI